MLIYRQQEYDYKYQTQTSLLTRFNQAFMESNWWFVNEIIGDELNNLRPLPYELINGF